MGADRPTLRAFLWCLAAALQCLTRTRAIACALCLAAKHHRNAEPINITLAEYQSIMSKPLPAGIARYASLATRHWDRESTFIAAHSTGMPDMIKDRRNRNRKA